MQRVLAFFVGCLVAGSGLAAETPIAANPFNEVLLPEARISGAIIVGVQSRNTSPGQIDITAVIPAGPPSTHACLQVSSIDGRYDAVMQYELPPISAPTRLSFDFPTTYGTVLHGLSHDQLGLHMHLGECGRGENAGSLVVDWNARDARTEPIDILLNSFRADMVFAYVGEAAQPVTCEKLEDPLRTAFDTKCRIEAWPTGRTILQIHRIHGQAQLPPTELPVWFPDG